MSERFLARNNLNRHTSLAILKQLRMTQRADDMALAERAKLMSDMLIAGVDVNLAIDRSHPAIAENLAVMGKLVEAREMTMGMHRYLATLGRDMGVDLRAEGCGASCGHPPPAAMLVGADEGIAGVVSAMVEVQH